MLRLLKILCVSLLACVLNFGQAFATQIWLDPLDQLYDVGETLSVDLYANIDEADAIFGFGFDLSFDEGISYIGAPGDSGSYLTFISFVANNIYFYDSMPPLWDDGDTISGEAFVGSDDIWGSDIILGTLFFESPSSGPIGRETIYLGAPDPDDPFSPDGLFRGDVFSPLTFMPNNPTASLTPVNIPEPYTALLLGIGLFSIVGLWRSLKR